MQKNKARYEGATAGDIVGTIGMAFPATLGATMAVRDDEKHDGVLGPGTLIAARFAVPMALFIFSRVYGSKHMTRYRNYDPEKYKGLNAPRRSKALGATVQHILHFVGKTVPCSAFPTFRILRACP